MTRLSAGKRVAETLSPPLPIRNRHFDRANVQLRRSQFSILAAAPGVGKSVTATNIAVMTPVPTLFLSADSDEWTVRTRCCSILTHVPLDTIEERLTTGGAWEGYYAEQLRAVDHVDWCFNSDIDPEFIVNRMEAYAEIRGEYPHLLVVDNLINTVYGDSDDYGQLRGVCRELQRIARQSDAHVLALHHVTGAKEDGQQVITQGDLLGKLAKIPEVVIGLHNVSEYRIGLNVAKNRGKRKTLVEIDLDYSTARLDGWEAA